MNLSLRQLKVFIGVASAASFTKTAQRLHLSQAALSAIIRELETQLQCRLLDRTTRTVTLTEAGRLFLPTATHIVESLENSALELGKIGREEQRVLRVGVTPHIATSVMPAVLKRFSVLHPAVRVDMTDSTPDELQRMVEAGDVDAAFGAFFTKASGIDRQPIFPTRLVLASPLSGAGNLPSSGKGEATWQALQGMPLICLPKDNPIQRLIEENLASEQVTPSKRTAVGHIETAIAMAEAGFGLAILPSISQATAQRYRVRLDVIHPVVEIAFYCITRAGRGHIGTVQEFSSVLEEVTRHFHSGSSSKKRAPRKPKAAAAPE